MKASALLNTKKRNGLGKIDSSGMTGTRRRPFSVTDESLIAMKEKRDAEGDTAIKRSGLSTATLTTESVDRDARLESIWCKLPDGVIVCDAQGKIVLTNTVARELAQIDPLGMSLESAPLIWGRMLDTEGREILPEDWPTMKASRGCTTTQQECRLQQTERVHHDVLFSAAPIFTASSEPAGVIATLTDVTELKRRALTLRQQAISRERSRMAEDIHDAFCQGLNSIMLQLEIAQDCVASDCESALRHIRTACDIARATVGEARRSMWTFCHESLGDVDPASRLSELAKQMLQGTPITLALSLPQQPRKLPPRVLMEFLRIGQEALSNVVRHSGATKVDIELAYEEQALHLLVRDDGCGFIHPPADPVRRGFGLISMQERAERLGGKITIDTRPGRGTRLAAVIPLPPVAA